MQKIPYPTSKFLKVKCPGCNNEQTIFESAKIAVQCNVCGGELAKPRGGKSAIIGEVIETLS